MKKRFKVIPMILGIMLLISATTVTYASEDMTTEEKARALYDLELFHGLSSTEFQPYLEGLSNREQAIKMIVVALDLSVDQGIKSSYIGVSSWAQPYVALAYSESMTEGMGINEDGQPIFGGDAIITARQFQTWFDRVLTDGANTWEENADLDNTVCINRGQLVDMTYDALKRTPQSGTETLVENIVKEDIQRQQIAMEAGLLSSGLSIMGGKDIEDHALPLGGFEGVIDPSNHTIKDIEVVSLKEIVVTFTADLNAYSAGLKSHYSLYDNGGNEVVHMFDEVDLTADNQVTLLFEENLNGRYTLKLDGVVDLNGKSVDDEVGFYMIGFETATIEAVGVYGRSFIQIIFSGDVDQESAEEEDYYTLFDKDGNEIEDFIEDLTLDKGNLLNMIFDMDLVDGKYTIKVKGVEDSHGNIIKDQNTFRVQW